MENSIAKVPKNWPIPLHAISCEASPSEVLKFFLGCFFGKSEFECRDGIQQIWIGNSDSPKKAIPILSVRTAVDLFLQAKKYPEGTELLTTALNIPDMIDIFKNHGLVPIPVEISSETLFPDLKKAQKLVTPKTKLFLVAHLFGVTFRNLGLREEESIGKIVDFAKKNNLDVMEDLAQSFSGFHYQGHPDSDIVLYSFGTIKVNTAMGGGVYIAKDPQLLSEMQRIHSSYPIFPKTRYFKKLLINCFLLFLQSRIAAILIFWWHRYIKIDLRKAAVSKVRGFPPDPYHPFRRYRFQPCLPLLRALEYRLRTFSFANRHLQQNRIRSFSQSLLSQGWSFPGWNVLHRDFWLFPVFLPDGVDFEFCQKLLFKMGLDASNMTTQLKLVESPPNISDKSASETPQAAKIMNNVFYLPVNSRATVGELNRIQEAMARLKSEISAIST